MHTIEENNKSEYLADETYVKNCKNCGKKIVSPFLFKGYVFCSDQCREQFLAEEGKR